MPRSSGVMGPASRSRVSSLLSARALALLHRTPPVALRHAVEPGVVHGDWVTRLAQVGRGGKIVVDVVAAVVVANITVISGSDGRCW